MDNLHLFHKGRDAATNDMDIKGFDVDAAIASFKNDPADSPFQRGYLRELIKSGEGSVMDNYEMPTTDIEAFTLALRLAVNAPTNELAQAPLAIAKALETRLTAKQVEGVTAMLEKEAAK